MVEARINSEGDGILLVDTGSGESTLRVTEGSTTTAADLHILGEAAQILQSDGSTIVGIDGSTTFTIELDADDSLVNLVTTINELGAGVVATTFHDGSIVRPFRLLLSSQPRNCDQRGRRIG